MTTIGKNGTTQFNSFVDGLHKQGAITKQQMAVLKDGTVTNADRKIADSLMQKGKIFEGLALEGGLDTAARESKGTALFGDQVHARSGYAAQGAARAVENFSQRLQSELVKLHDAQMKGLRSIP
jgi:hypothetical protein